VLFRSAADPTHREAEERSGQDDRRCTEMIEHLVEVHAAQGSHHREACDQDQRDPVGDRHGEKVARRGKGHQRGKQQKSDDVEGHGNRPKPA